MTGKKTSEAHYREEKFSAAKDVQQNRQDNANQNAGDNRKVESRAAALNVNITGQTSEPTLSEARPEENADECYSQSGEDQDFSEAFHST